MVQISKKISNLVLSPTVMLNAKARKLKADGFNVLNFTVGEPDYPTPKPIVDVAIKALQSGNTGYGQAGGGLAFRTAICEKYLHENNLNYTPNQVVCGIGAKELLFHVCMAILNDGDEVLINAPAWPSYSEQVRALGGIPIMIPYPEHHPEMMFESDYLEQFATSKTVAYILCNPNNPMGYTLQRHELKKLGDYLETKNWWVVIDEIYEYLSYDHDHVSLLETNPNLLDRCILINGMSKGYAMTGWRVGYAIGPKEVIQFVTTLQSHSSTCLPPFIEEAATWAIKQRKYLMMDQISELKKKRDFVIKWIDKIEGLSFMRPQGAFYIFINIKTVLKNSTRFQENDSMGFCQYLLDQYHMAVVPGEAFSCPGYIRISFASPYPVLEDGFNRLQIAVNNL